MRKIEQYNYSNKRVFLRLDLNVPISNGKILDDTRIKSTLPSIEYLLKQNAKIIIASHFGRPKGKFEEKYSLEFLSNELAKRLNQEVLFCPETIGNKAEEMSNNLQPKQILLLENLRFHPGETKNDSDFASNLAKLADFYINDAFSCCHRSHASIAEITEYLPSAAGLSLSKEIDNLTKYLSKPKKPMMAIIGGSKVSTKLDLLYNLIDKVDYLVIGGAMANTFLKSQGIAIGASLYEEELLNSARDILNKATSCKIILPQDVVTAKEISNESETSTVDIKYIPADQMILDIGPNSAKQIIEVIKQCKTVVMNGPLGVFEYPPFSLGTSTIAKEIVKLTQSGGLISVAGGGDIVAALSQNQLLDKFTYISTAGGAFLEWLEGKTLPGIKALK
ncbi:MAG: phosphoglycerate kinase [Rickettsiales bacterium]|jgi:phosphoglycerate kinase|nr:phosphoglycerate kinase [Rickettsiales bacterium]